MPMKRAELNEGWGQKKLSNFQTLASKTMFDSMDQLKNMATVHILLMPSAEGKFEKFKTVRCTWQNTTAPF